MLKADIDDAVDPEWPVVLVTIKGRFSAEAVFYPAWNIRPLWASDRAIADKQRECPL